MKEYQTTMSKTIQYLPASIKKSQIPSASKFSGPTTTKDMLFSLHQPVTAEWSCTFNPASHKNTLHTCKTTTFIILIQSHTHTRLTALNHTSTPPLSFLQAGCPSCRPTNSIKALKAKSTEGMCVWHSVYDITLANVLEIYNQFS